MGQSNTEWTKQTRTVCRSLEIAVEDFSGNSGRYGQAMVPKLLQGVELNKELAIFSARSAHHWLVPTPENVKLVGERIGSGKVIASLLGVTPRTWRTWLADPSRMSWATWRVLCELAGINNLPDIRATP